jgi:hypothetical protein
VETFGVRTNPLRMDAEFVAVLGMVQIGRVLGFESIMFLLKELVCFRKCGPLCAQLWTHRGILTAKHATNTERPQAPC